jgi:hypothetical protein
MFSSIRATLLLADHAQGADGKLNMIGAGWSITGPQPSPFALAALIEFPWSEAGTKHDIRFELIDSEGVAVKGPDDETIAFEITEFPVSAGFGVTKGTPIIASVAVNCGPIPIPPGGRFEWRLLVDGEPIEHGSAWFTTRPLPKAA